MDLEKAYNKSKNIPGWFSLEDARALMELLINSSGKIVEVGSFLGKSAVFTSCFKPVVCIDPWKANDALKNKIIEGLGENYKNDKILSKGNFYHLFEKFAIKENEFGYNVTAIKKPDTEVFNNWNGGKIGVLFLDHNHTYDSVMASLLGWKPHMAQDGKILIHDSNWIVIKNAINASKIFQCKIYSESLFKPMLCFWPSIKIL